MRKRGGGTWLGCERGGRGVLSWGWGSVPGNRVMKHGRCMKAFPRCCGLLQANGLGQASPGHSELCERRPGLGVPEQRREPKTSPGHRQSRSAAARHCQGAPAMLVDDALPAPRPHQHAVRSLAPRIGPRASLAKLAVPWAGLSQAVGLKKVPARRRQTAHRTREGPAATVAHGNWNQMWSCQASGKVRVTSIKPTMRRLNSGSSSAGTQSSSCSRPPTHCG